MRGWVSHWGSGEGYSLSVRIDAGNGLGLEDERAKGGDGALIFLGSRWS